MDEYISREEVVKEIKSRIYAADDAWESGYNTAMAEIMEWIKHIPAAETEPANGGWISVDDRLPEYDKTVLVINDDGYMHTAIRTERSIGLDDWQIKFGAYPCDNDCWDRDEQGTITHWRPLPEPPKEDKDGKD